MEAGAQVSNTAGQREPRRRLPPKMNTSSSLDSMGRSPVTLRFMRSETYREIGAMLDESYYGPATLLLLLGPVAFVVDVFRLPAVTVFFANLAALVPLAALTTFTVLALTKNAGIAGGLVRAILGNATELILGITVLCYGKIQLVQSIIIGSTLIYSLFVLGGSFLHASYGKKKEIFSKTRTGVMSALIMTTSTCMIIPTILAIAAKDGDQEHASLRVGVDDRDNTLLLSYITAAVMFFLFLSYLGFRFRTHSQLFPHNPSVPQYNPDTHNTGGLHAGRALHMRPSALILAFTGSIAGTVMCSIFLVRSTDETIKTLHLTHSFAGLVLLPLTGGLAKSFTIIRHARSQGGAQSRQMSQLDFSIRSIMTNVLNTLLFIVPLLVLLGWPIGQPMTLEFGLFEAAAFFMSILVMTYLIQHGKTTYFEGFMLIGTYISIAAAFYVRPESAEAASTI